MKTRTYIMAAMAVTIAMAVLVSMLHSASMDDREQPSVSAIVQGADLATVVAAVDAVGGEITHQLGVINAVGANLTPTQRQRLTERQQIRIYENRRVRSAGSTVTATLRDEFSTDDFSGNDGTAQWSTDWLEDDPLDGGAGPSAGQVRVTGGVLRLDDAPNTGGMPSAARGADLSGNLTAAELRFEYETSPGVDTNDAVSVEVSSDGGVTYTVLETFTGLSGSRSGSRSFNILDFASADTTVRFRVSRYYGMQGEYFYVDNLEIGYTIDEGTDETTDGGEGESDSADGGESAMLIWDCFDEASFANNDGTTQWSTGWLEDDPLSGGSGPSAGQVRVTGGSLRLDDYPDTGGMPSAARGADLSGDVTAARLSFEYGTSSGVDNNDAVSVEVSSDGGVSYTVLEIFTGFSGSRSGSISYDILGFASADTMVRFRVENNYGGQREYFYVDDLKIEYTIAHGAYDGGEDAGDSGDTGDTGDTGDSDESDDTPGISNDQVKMIGADELHRRGITGAGVTVAVLDTGYTFWPQLVQNALGEYRRIASYNTESESTPWPYEAIDFNGHGTHVTSLILSSLRLPDGTYQGVAPDADLVAVKVFNDRGEGTYLDVIEGIDYVVTNRDEFDIKVLNLSLCATAVSHYWDDPLNQAVMAAWNAGIVVVASAGNSGPEAMTIGVPGNVPYVITVGAVSDNYTPDDPSDEFVTSFSSAGPTVEGFVKPDVVAPGGHLDGLMMPFGRIALEHPENVELSWEQDCDDSAHDWYGNGLVCSYTMSGTSQAAAVVSGVVALMLQESPWLTPDEVKGRLMANARPALDSEQQLAFSIFQQGAGLVDAADAVDSTEIATANQGLDIELDLSGDAHYGGLANQDEEGNYYIMGLDGYVWSGGYMWSDAVVWSGGYMWSDALTWSSGYMWSDSLAGSSGYMWSDSLAFIDGYMWSDGLAESMSINRIVGQE